VVHLNEGAILHQTFRLIFFTNMPKLNAKSDPDIELVKEPQVYHYTMQTKQLVSYVYKGSFTRPISSLL
jgi:hypothetical protein